MPITWRLLSGGVRLVEREAGTSTDSASWKQQ